MRRRSFLPTFSKLGLAERCLYAWNGGVRWPRRPQSVFASRGVAATTVAEEVDAAPSPVAAVDGPRLEQIAADNELSDTDRAWLHGVRTHLRLLALAERDDLARRPELPLAYDPETRTARVPAQRHPRDYSDVAPHELWGRPDLVRITSSYELVVRDYKASYQLRRTRPRDVAQLRACGLAAARYCGVHEVQIQIALIGDDGIDLVTDTMSAWDLITEENRLAELVSRLDTDRAPHPGRWCYDSYCPIVADCVATKRLEVQIAEEIEPPFELSTEIQSPEHARWQREALKRLQRAIGQYEHAVKTWAKREPIPVGGGKVYGMRDHESRSIRPVPAAWDVLDRLGLGAAKETEVTNASLKRAIKAACVGAPRGAQAALERQAWAELELAGAVHHSSYRKLEEYKAQ